MSDLQIGLITTGLTVLAAALGYAYREIRQRANPFIKILDFGGGIQEKRIQVKLHKKTADRSQTAIMIRHLHEDDTLSGCDRALDEARELTDEGEELIQKVSNVADAIAQPKSIDTICQSLSEALDSKLLDKFIMLVLAKNTIKLGAPTPDLPIVLEVHSSKDKQGCVWLGFPGDPKRFGAGFDEEPILKAVAMPFVGMISKVDKQPLLAFFASLKDCLKEEVAIAKEILPVLTQSVQEHCRWGTIVFLANITSHPILVMLSATLSIKDETGAKFTEECYLVRLVPNEQGEMVRRDATAPLIIRTGGDDRFEFMTRKTQIEMTRGKAMRDAFESGKAMATIEFTIQRPGLISKKSLRTTPLTFSG